MATTHTAQPGDSAVVFVNVIELPADQVGAFVEGWHERADFMRHQPGFREYTLHRAALPSNRFQLINIARWESQEAFQAAVSDPQFHRQIEALNNNPDLEVTANPGIYRVAVHASAAGNPAIAARQTETQIPEHPHVTVAEHLEEAKSAVAELVSQLQQGLDRGDADTYNESVAADVLWGGPFGATIRGYDELHRIHQRLLADSAAGPSRYEIIDVSAPTKDVALAQVRRTPRSTGDFAEIALYVLTRTHGRWWLAAGQNTVVQPGRSANSPAGQSH